MQNLTIMLPSRLGCPLSLKTPNMGNTSQESPMYVESLPFRFPDTLEGLVRSGGVLRAEADGLVLEFQTRDGLFGVIKSGVKKVAIPFDRIDEVRLRSNLFRTELEIRVSSMELAADVPGSKHGTIRLKVPRRYRTEAREMALEASDRVSQCKLDRLERDIEGAK